MRLKSGFLPYFAILALTLGLPGGALAQSKSSTALMSVPATPSAFSLETDVDYYSNLYKSGVFERQEELDYTFVPAYEFNSTWSMNALVIVTQDTLNTQDSVLSNTPVSLVMNEFTKETRTSLFQLKGKLSGILPTDQNARVNQTFNGGFGIGEILVWDHPMSRLPTKFLLKQYFTRNLHSYDVASDGSFNVEYLSATKMSFTLYLTQKFSVILKAEEDVGFAYHGEQASAFLTDAILSYDFNKIFSMNVGLANHGDMLVANGKDSNFSYFNDQSSQAHIGIGVNL